MRLSSKFAETTITIAVTAQITPRLTRGFAADSGPIRSGGMSPMPLNPCNNGKVPNSEKKLSPQATETSARKCPDSRAVISPSSQAIVPVTTRPTTRPAIGGAPSNRVSNVVAYAARPTNVACPNDVCPLIPVSRTRPTATSVASPTYPNSVM